MGRRSFQATQRLLLEAIGELWDSLNNPHIGDHSQNISHLVAEPLARAWMERLGSGHGNQQRFDELIEPVSGGLKM